MAYLRKGTAFYPSTVTAGTLGNNIIMPRIKEFDRFYYATATTTSDTLQDAVNISSDNYLTLTPEHTDDLFEFSWQFCVNSSGYLGYGVQRDTATTFDSGNLATQWSTGRHTWGNFSGASIDFANASGSITVTATGLSADTPYYFRMIGQTHSTPASHTFGIETTSDTNGVGIYMSAKRWSIV